METGENMADHGHGKAEGYIREGESGKRGHFRLNTALYIRLSREDGDRAESLSVANQRILLTEFVRSQSDLYLYDIYIDDGWSGVSFERPGFQRMLKDIENKKIQCVAVKDLSRLGRNMPKVSEYINEYFPGRRVRFISVNDGIDRQYYDIDTGEEMMIDVKNMFNGFYPKDISKKVRSTFRAKQERGQFIGAFASFGYQKSESDHNRLAVDEYAAGIVRRIFGMYLDGLGQNTIARMLNEEGIPCPSEYKKSCGLNYHNGNRLAATSYWTYSTVRRILRNEIYVGNMVQNRSFRQICKKNALSLPKEKWIIVENTHQPIIDRDTWKRVQNLLKQNTRQTGLSGSIHMFAGFLKCGDCGRAMVKIRRKGGTFFNCGSYNRCGKKVCSIHNITEQELEKIVLGDLNLIIRSAKNMSRMIGEEKEKQRMEHAGAPEEVLKYQMEAERFARKKEQAYEDYSDHIITREDYLRYKEKYEARIEAVQARIALMRQSEEAWTPGEEAWTDHLLGRGGLDCLDRKIVVEMVSMIYVYEDNRIKIVYNFSDELETLLIGSAQNS